MRRSVITAFDFEAVTAALAAFVALALRILFARLFVALVSHAWEEHDLRRTSCYRRPGTAAPLILPEFQNGRHCWPLLHGAPARFAIGIPSFRHILDLPSAHAMQLAVLALRIPESAHGHLSAADVNRALKHSGNAPS